MISFEVVYGWGKCPTRTANNNVAGACCRPIRVELLSRTTLKVHCLVAALGQAPSSGVWSHRNRGSIDVRDALQPLPGDNYVETRVALKRNVTR